MTNSCCRVLVIPSEYTLYTVSSLFHTTPSLSWRLAAALEPMQRHARQRGFILSEAAWACPSSRARPWPFRAAWACRLPSSCLAASPSEPAPSLCMHPGLSQIASPATLTSTEVTCTHLTPCLHLAVSGCWLACVLGSKACDRGFCGTDRSVRYYERDGPRMPPGLVMSWMLDRRLSFLFMELRRMKYFCACEATCASSNTSCLTDKSWTMAMQVCM